MSSVAGAELGCSESEYRKRAVHCALESIRAKAPEDRELYFKMSLLWLQLAELANKLEVRAAVRETRRLAG